MNTLTNTLHNTLDNTSYPTVLPTTPQENTMNAVPTPTPLSTNPIAENKLFLLLTQLQETIGGIKHELLSLGHLLAQPTPTPPDAQTDLVQAVETVLQEGTWFADKVSDAIETHVEDMDSLFDDKVLNCVEAYMSNSFDIRDHVSIRDEVNDELGDVLDGLVETAIDDVLEDKVREILSNKTITINL